MRQVRFRTSRLVQTVAMIELLEGLGLYLFPDQFGSTLYEPIRPYLPWLSAGLLAGGVMLYMVGRYRRFLWLGRLLALLGAVPIAVLAYTFAGPGTWSGPIIHGLLGLAAAAALWLPEGDFPARPTGVSLMDLTLAAIELCVGVLFLLGPALVNVAYGPMQAALPVAGVTGLLGGAVLVLVGLRLRNFRHRLWRLAPALMPFGLAIHDFLAAHWTGALTWGVLTVVVLSAKRLRVHARLKTLSTEDGETWDALPEHLENILELWLWTLALTVVVLTPLSDPGTFATPAIAGLFVVTVTLYNAITFRLLRDWGPPRKRVTVHLAFVTLATGLLVVDHGMIGHALLGPFLMSIPVAARVLGTRRGFAILGLALATILGGGVVEWLQGGAFGLVLGGTLLDLAGLLTAAFVGIGSARVQRRVALELATARQELQREVQQRQLIEKISDAVRSSLNLEEIFQATVEELGAALQVDRCTVRRRTGDELLPPSHQYVAPGVEPLADFRPQGLTSMLRDTGTAIAIADVTADPLLGDSPDRQMLITHGVKSLLIAPIRSGGDLLGIVTFHQTSHVRHWTRSEIEFLEAVAGHVAIAVVQGRAHRALSQNLSDLQAMHTELQDAHEELQAAHEELQAREEELVAQQEELQAQQEELQAQQEELEEALEQTRQAEAAHARLAAVLEATTDLVAVSDMNGHRIYMNQAGRSLLGFGSDDQVEGQEIGVVHPDWARHLVQTEGIPTALRDGVWRGESAYMSQDGREIPVSQVIISHKSLDGTPTYLSTIVRDMTEWKKTEAALQASESRFRSAFDHAPIGMAVMGPDGRLLEVNQALCLMLDFAEEDLLGRTLADFMRPSGEAVEPLPLAALLHGEHPSYRAERQLLSRTNAALFVELSLAAVAEHQEHPQYLLAQIQDITDRKLFEQQLVRMASYDPLTDMFNRRRFEEELEKHLQLADRYSQTGALLFIDLDQFKYVNDSLGHQAGDLFLKGLSAMLRRRLRKTDILARLGGDEFAVLLPQTDRDQAQVVAEEIRKAIRSYTQVISGQPISTTASIGVAIFPEHGRTVEELLARADMAMYQAKEQGRNRFHLLAVGTTEQEKAVSKLTWERRIREALEHDRFVLHQQPILDLSNGEIVHHELLLRMPDEQGGLIPPMAFLDTAERFGLIRSIDRWVVSRAIQLIAAQAKIDPNICLEVNLSGRAFDDRELVRTIEQELAVTGINPRSLVLEITETAAIADLEQASRFVSSLKDLGCRFAIDDFGSGFASFYYLKHLPVDYLKLDGSFIRNLPSDPVDQHLVRAMVEVARGLGKQTIAEFVETEETLRLLKSYGVDFAQGYFIGRPGPLSDCCPPAAQKFSIR